MLQGTIKSCLKDKPEERPTFEYLEKDVFYQCVDTLCRQKSDDADQKTIKLIDKYATPQILDHQDSINGRSCIFDACVTGRTNVVDALIKKGADVKLIDTNRMTALHFAV